ncbi:MAG: threonylcarbamoyl-AMP synthase [Burkholderiaceae bacterium]|nr:threonylcarbamoyl-AMP synthase [Roseateles sp.]MBV8468480.1 threonylcarbamoyl-AMP synthase [Burkholderiaceae bacterium]
MLLNGHDAQALQQAAQALAQGELVAMPTETVYGLAARADDDAAVAKIFAAKGRPADHPLIVHVLDAADAACFAAELPQTARALMQAFWPGPLTVIVPRAPGVAEAAAGGQATVGLRSPAHPVARQLLAAAHALGVRGVAAPSANRFGRVSPTQARHVQDEFGDALRVLDGGDCHVGIESAIVDCSREFPVLLRPGVLTAAQLEAVLGQPLRERDAAAPKASGTLEAHYAPTATVRLKSAEQIFAALASFTGGWPAGLAVYSRSVPAQQTAPTAFWRAMPTDALAAAQELFTVLRELDAAGVREIWVETPPPDSAWAGVLDRLSRAAAAFEP